LRFRTLADRRISEGQKVSAYLRQIEGPRRGHRGTEGRRFVELAGQPGKQTRFIGLNRGCKLGNRTEAKGSIFVRLQIGEKRIEVVSLAS
jgi:hypothetical protein